MDNFINYFLFMWALKLVFNFGIFELEMILCKIIIATIYSPKLSTGNSVEL